MDILLNIKELCKSKGITLVDLATQMGISYQAFHASLTRNPSIGRLQEVAAILEVEVTDLLRSKTEGISCPHCGGRLELKKG